MRIESVIANMAKGGEGSSDSLLSLLGRAGAQQGRVLAGQTPGLLNVGVAGAKHQIPAGVKLPPGTLVRLSLHPTSPNTIVIETLGRSEGAAPSLQLAAGSISNLLRQLGLPDQQSFRAVVRVLLGLGVPADAGVITQLEQLLTTPSSQNQMLALRILLTQGLPISQGALAEVERWLASTSVQVHLSEIMAQERRGDPDAQSALARWILSLNGQSEGDAKELAQQLRQLLVPFRAPSGMPDPDSLPQQLHALLSRDDTGEKADKLLCQMRAAQLFSSSGAGEERLLLPLFLHVDDAPVVAWAMFRRESGEGSETTEEAPMAFSLSLTLSNLGPMQIDMWLRGDELSARFTLWNDRAAAAVQEQLHSLHDNLEKQGYMVGALNSSRSTLPFRDLMQQLLESLSSSASLEGFDFTI
jgi:Flagellar hook-length control protein FliK